MVSVFRGLHRKIIVCLPILTVLTSVITITITYIIAKNEQSKKKDAGTSNCTLHEAFPPYISDVGDCMPQSSVFTFGMVLSGCVTLIIIVIRYVQVRNFYVNCDRVNLASLIIGIVLVIGKFLTVSFQLSSQKLVHYIGACAYFGGTFLFCCCQAAITWHNSKLKVLFYMRLLFSVGMFCTGLMFSLFLLPSLEKYSYRYHIAPIAEWCFALLKMLLMLSFCGDFQHILPIFDIRRSEEYDVLCNGEGCQAHPWCNPNEYEMINVPKPIYGIVSQV